MRAKILKILLVSLALGPVLSVALPTQADAAITSRGLLYRLDAKNPASYTTGSTVWKDLSGNGYDVTLYNGASTACSTPYVGANTCASSYSETVASGVRMPAMQFYNQTSATSGKYGAFNAGGAISWGAFPGFSITFYANFGTTNGNWDRIIDFGSSAGANNIEIARSNNSTNLTLEIWNSATSQSYGYCSNSIISNNTWAHYAVVADGTNCYMYKNNGSKSTTSYSGLPSNVSRLTSYLGRSWWSGDAMFSGGIADIAMYNVALTDAEVAQNFAEQTAAQIITFTSTAPTSAVSGVGSYAVTDTVTSQLPITNTIDATSASVCSISGGTVTFTTGGTCKINANQPGNAHYSAAAQVQQSFGITTNSSLIFSIAGGATTATYRQSLGLTATVTSTGKVTFYQQGKTIPGCKGLSGTGTITCNWKPSQKSIITLSVQFVPSNAQLATRYAGPINISVSNRSNKR